MKVLKVPAAPPPEQSPNDRPKTPKNTGTSFDGLHQLAIFLVTVGAVIGFTHKFAYMQALGVNIELGNEKPAQLAVDALQSLQEYWLVYGCLVLAAIVLVILIGELEQRDMLPVKPGSLRACTMCAFLSTVAYVSLSKGNGDAMDLIALRFPVGDVSRFQQIVMPPQSASSDAAICFTWSTPTPKADAGPVPYDFVVAETEDRIHVVQIMREPKHVKGVGSPTSSSIVRPVVFLKSMVPCYRRIMPGGTATAPQNAPSQTPPNEMPPTPPARISAVLRS